MGSAASKGGGGGGGARGGPIEGHTASSTLRSGGRRGLVYGYGGRRPRVNITEPKRDKVTPTSDATTADPASGDIYHPPKVCSTARVFKNNRVCHVWCHF